MQIAGVQNEGLAEPKGNVGVIPLLQHLGVMGFQVTEAWVRKEHPRATEPRRGLPNHVGNIPGGQEHLDSKGAMVDCKGNFRVAVIDGGLEAGVALLLM